ncbi:MAG: lipid-A-disaccharide synthase [Flavobacteriaceae bacterium]|nr:lipid-A-disaccharide synthase [Flavobacteriaceae bacterium]
MAKKYYIISGEASGDLHGSNLMKSILKKEPNAEIRFWGGDLMQSVGGTLVKHYKDLAFMGFWEVLQNLGTILNNIKFCKQDIKNYKPDTLILIDYPGFNLRIAKFAKLLGIRVIYYISPQLWAWKENRVEIIRKYVDEMLVILPFEKDFYKKHNIESHFVGHPLLDEITHLQEINPNNFREENGLNEKEIIALLPGSRKQEVKKMLRIMLSVAPYFKDYQFVIAGAPSLPQSFYAEFLTPDVHFVSNKTYDLLRCSRAALVASGTATLETALLQIPQVVCYRGHWLSYQIAKRLVKHIKFISLVNLIMNKEIVKELIQNNLNARNLKTELQNILEENKREKLLSEYRQLLGLLGGAGASDRATEVITKY